MAEHTPGYIAALAAALAQANADALIAAENGDHQLGRPVQNHPGLRIWNGDLLRVGHLPKTPFAVEVNLILPDGHHVDLADHEHARRDLHGWVFCAPDADGAVPITIAVTQTLDPEDQDQEAHHP